MYAIKAIYDGVSFKPKQPISVKGEYEVIITFIEPVNKVAKKIHVFYLNQTQLKILLLVSMTAWLRSLMILTIP